MNRIRTASRSINKGCTNCHGIDECTPGSATEVTWYANCDSSALQKLTCTTVCDEDCAVTVTCIDCDGNPFDVTGWHEIPPPQVVTGEVALDPGTLQVLIDAITPGKFDSLKLCDPTTGLPVVVVVGYDTSGAPTSVAYDFTGAAWAGDIATLVACDTPDIEADPIHWCVDGAEFTQYVIKRDGVPTGEVLWTDATGAHVADPTLAAAFAAKGICAEVYCAPAAPRGILTTLDQIRNL